MINPINVKVKSNSYSKPLNNTISETPTQHIQMPTVEEDNPLNVYNVNPTPVQTPVVEQPAVVEQPVVSLHQVEREVFRP